MTLNRFKRTVFITLLSVGLALAAPASAKKKPSLEIFPYGGFGTFFSGTSSATMAPVIQQAESKTLQTVDKKDFVSRADTALVHLIQGNDQQFIAAISTNMLRHFGPDKLQKNVVSALIPYFQEFKEFETKMTIVPTRDSWDNEGYSLYQSFKTKDGAKKSFLIQMIVEGEDIVVANLTPDVKSPYK